MQNNPGYKLRIESDASDLQYSAQLAAELRCTELFATLLCQRGITTADDAHTFLHPRLADLPSPFLMKDMEEGVSLVAQALRENWQICVHGDYDVDGISATALLSRFFTQLGVQTTCYQPDRLTEGYGLQPEFIRRNAPSGNIQKLLITVDCGVSAIDEVRLARELGYRVIVTDHHEPPELLPSTDALINPKRKDCSFPYKELSGVGVAFFLIIGIRSKLAELGVSVTGKGPNLKQFTDLVALGTVADVMPLSGINRILVTAGLETMTNQPNPWVSALKLINNMQNPGVSPEDISFRFAPRLNAPGRLGDPRLSFDLLISDEPGQATDLVRTIDTINTRRRELEKKGIDSVYAECEKQLLDGIAGFVVYGDYHPGIIGILASRVVDKYQKPVIIFTDNSTETAEVKGSGRSIATVNLYETLKLCRDSIIQFGGHPMAAGLTVTKENLPLFRERFNSALARHDSFHLSQKTLMVDARVSAEELFDESFLRFYHQLEPFGAENPEPVFLLNNPKVSRADCLKAHLKYTINVNGSSYNGIGFGLAGKKKRLLEDGAQPAIKIRRNTFRGVERTELYTIDVI